MILIYLIFALSYLHREKQKLGKTARSNISILIIFAVIGMLTYELYVEYGVGWEYGVPHDDDAGWIFRAATALKNGESWDRLYLYAHNAEWNDSRVLSLTTLGQYVYAAFVSSALYYPTFFSIRISLYLLYVFQIILVSAAIIECNLALDFWNADLQNNRRPSKTSFFFLILFYPVVIFNTYKTLRESLFIFLSLKTLISFIHFIQKKGKLRTLVFYALCLLIVRPNSVIITFGLFVWCAMGEQVTLTTEVLVSGLLFVGTFLLTQITKLLGWNYGVGSVEISELIHLLMFPSPISQTINMLAIGKNPSWVTPMYFAQSVWNIPILSIAAWGILHSMKKKQNMVWLVMWLNALMVYSLAYSSENMTPRYKLIFFIPQTVFLYIGLVQMKKTFHR